MTYIYSETLPPELPHLIVYQSRDYNLGIPEDRRLAAEIIVALAAFFIKQDERSTPS